MSREYFTMLGAHIFSGKKRKKKKKKTTIQLLISVTGTLSSTQFGLEIMARNKLFDYLKPMSELPHRDDLSHLIMTSLDYNMYDTFSPPFLLFLFYLTFTAVLANRERFWRKL
jgi:hypothetical protein